MEYQVVWNWDLSVLSRNVTGLAEKGWVPQGGIAVGERDNFGGKQLTYFQAMVKNP